MRASLPLPALLASVLAVAACGDPTDPGGVATISLTLPSALLIGDTVTAEVILRDLAGNVLEGRPVTFTSSAPTIASVSAAGLVTGLPAGGPVSITARSSGVAATVNLLVRDDARFGYARVDDATSGSSTPSPLYAFNSSGGAITISRSAVGTYVVRFAGLARATGQRENVQVTAFVDGAFCNSGGTQTEGTDLLAQVRCFAPGGAPMDSRHTVLVVGARALPGRLGFALADQPGQSSYRPAAAHNSAFGAITVTRTGLGVYRAEFSGLGRDAAFGLPEMVMVTQVGANPFRCVVLSWNVDGLSADIACTDQAGTPMDTQFNLLVMERGRPGQRTGFAWANDPAASTYTPSPLFSSNSGGGPITAFRSGPGTYQIDFDNFIKGTGSETVVITAHGAADRFCRTEGWGMNTATAFRVNVACYDPSGTPADSRYNIIVIQ